MAFYEYCVPCGLSFQNPEAWNQHLQEHRKRREEIAAKRIADKKPVEKKVDVVPGADPAEVEDSRLAKTTELRSMKRALKKLNIECQTMTADETRKAFDKAVAEGKIEVRK